MPIATTFWNTRLPRMAVYYYATGCFGAGVCFGFLSFLLPSLAFASASPLMLARDTHFLPFVIVNSAASFFARGSIGSLCTTPQTTGSRERETCIGLVTKEKVCFSMISPVSTFFNISSSSYTHGVQAGWSLALFIIIYLLRFGLGFSCLGIFSLHVFYGLAARFRASKRLSIVSV